MNEMREIRERILDWYHQHKRDLPWRGSKDPYVIWIAEVIFQQTRISQGMDYFLRFLDRFPSLTDLAKAEEQEVLKNWEGLGYYARARNLHASAREIMQHHDGVFPHRFEEILQLKGIGDYTASCIASICFGEPQAAVDGNVYRVLSRLFAKSDPIDKPTSKMIFKKLAQELLDQESPGDFNEAMMDLGATICMPANPMCHSCPVSSNCLALGSQSVDRYPVRTPKKALKERQIDYLLVEKDGKIPVGKRTHKDIWQGLYELPLVEGIDQKGLELIFNTHHLLTHQKLAIRIFRFAEAIPIPNELSARYIWIEKSQVSRYPFPKPLLKFLNDYFR